MTSTKDCSSELARAARLLRAAGRIAVGVGEGLTAAAGLDEEDPALARRWLPGFTEIGLKNLREIKEIIGPIGQNRPEVYWGFWGQYLLRTQYETPLLEPYRRLAGLLEGRAYFACAATTDNQLRKAGLDEERLLTPMGDARYFQCAKPCCDALHHNEAQVRTMVEYLMTPREIDTRDIPECPRCGGHLLPNLRGGALGEAFVEEPHLRNYAAYRDFLKGCGKGPAVLLELGVGTGAGSGVIRQPFEQCALDCPEAVLIRVGRDNSGVPGKLGARGISLPLDPARALEALARA